MLAKLSRTKPTRFQKLNNLDWLRLLFALQVAVAHSVSHLEQKSIGFLDNFPGVPAFFFVSGLLIYASYQNCNNIGDYARNRAMRLLPALVVVTFFGVFLAISANSLEYAEQNYKTYFIWFFAQITLGQAYNPELFRNIGVGVINGSLWTITTEILFYIFVPFISYAEKFIRGLIYYLLVISFTVYAFGNSIFGVKLALGKTLFEFLGLTPIVWGWMFAFGIIAYKKFDFIAQFLPYFKYAAIPLIELLFLAKMKAL